MANGQYHGTIPNIAQAFQNDPRTKLAANALMAGTSTAPVAGGGWAWADGLSRIGQALLGAEMNRRQEKKYSGREEEYMKAMQQAAAQASSIPAQANPSQMNPAQANPAAANPSGYDAAAGALGGRVNVPQRGAVQPVQLPPSIPAGGAQGIMSGEGVTPTPDKALEALRGRPTGQFPMVEGPAPMPPMPDPMAGGTGPSRGAVRQALSPSSYFHKGIVPIEGGTDRNGRFLTSPKGAYGPSQLMPGTAPEAMELAGFDRNDTRWRTDAAINLKAGEAYYAKQLRDFGDPLKAAAAYNGGPGALRRVLRRAAKAGDSANWVNYYPATNTETPAYVKKFAAAIGSEGGAADPASMQANVPQAQMEAVPEIPAGPGTRPQAPQLPPEVQTNRIMMAQQMLNSGNPDLVSIAQTYLDKGLDEQQQARVLANQQAFQQGQTGFQADLNDWGQARGDERQFKYGRIRDVEQRNFQRGEREATQQYNSGERALDRAYGTSERIASQEYQSSENAANRNFQSTEADKQRTWQGNQADLDRGNKLDIASQRRQQFFSTPTGQKLQTDTLNGINTNNELIAQYETFMNLNRDQATGGVAMNTPIVGSLYNYMDKDLQQMNAIANDTTFKELGGLGTAISDGDRKFVEGTNVSTSNKGNANSNIAKARIGVLRRSNDFLTNYAMAQADGTQRQFMVEWAAFAKQVPIVVNGVARDRPMTFEEWKAKRPKYGADGKRTN